MTEHLHLNAFIFPVGHHEAAWRHPMTQPERIHAAGPSATFIAAPTQRLMSHELRKPE
jgi:hypothetical protein